MQQAGRRRVRRWWLPLGVLGGAVLVVATVLLWDHVPDVAQVQGWVLQLRAVGPLLPVVFVLVHALVTITPVPRTAFSVTAGVLFGPALGLGLTLLGATVSAALALLLVRAVGRESVAARLRHPGYRAVDERLARRGWAAVVSLRLVPVVPFWVINYAAGVSAVRAVPFLLATAVGMVPGTASVVLLGGAAAGHGSPWVVAVGVVCGVVGVLGLLVDARTPVKPEGLLSSDQGLKLDPAVVSGVRGTLPVRQGSTMDSSDDRP